MRASPNTVDLRRNNDDFDLRAFVANGVARAQRIAAHLAFDAARAAPAAAGDHPLLKEFVENQLVKRFAYPIDMGVIAELRALNCEIGIHGYNHDGRLFSSRGEFQRRATAINEALSTHEAVGFRAPMVHRNPEWLQDLNVAYDASFFDSDPFQAMPRGVGGVWPFIVGRIFPPAEGSFDGLTAWLAWL